MLSIFNHPGKPTGFANEKLVEPNGGDIEHSADQEGMDKIDHFDDDQRAVNFAGMAAEFGKDVDNQLDQHSNQTDAAENKKDGSCDDKSHNGDDDQKSCAGDQMFHDVPLV